MGSTVKRPRAPLPPRKDEALGMGPALVVAPGLDDDGARPRAESVQKRENFEDTGQHTTAEGGEAQRGRGSYVARVWLLVVVLLETAHTFTRLHVISVVHNKATVATEKNLNRRSAKSPNTLPVVGRGSLLSWSVALTTKHLSQIRWS